MIVDSVEEGSAYSAELSITPERRTSKSNWNEREVSVGYGNLSPGMKMAVKPSATNPICFHKNFQPESSVRQDVLHEKYAFRISKQRGKDQFFMGKGARTQIGAIRDQGWDRQSTK